MKKDFKLLFVTDTEEAALAIMKEVAENGAEVLPLSQPDSLAVFMEYQQDRAPVILSFDRTEEGKATADRIMKAAPEGWPIWNTAGSLCGEYSSIASAAKKDPEGFKKNMVEAIRRIYEVAKDSGYYDEQTEEAQQEPEKDALEAFLEEIQTRRFEPISTGIKDIDRALYGGFLRRTLVTLAAAPGAGKTALAQWIFENMAAAGHDVLYINLEMDRAQLLGRSISRLAWKISEDKKASLTALDVLRAYNWTPSQQHQITAAIDVYRQRIAPHFTYNPDSLQGIIDGKRGNHIDRIIATMKAEAERLKKEGRPAPIVCVDYLQIVNADGRETAEKIQTIVMQLKQFAIDNDTVVFLITAQNRAANKAGASEMESGRDTSNIEYSGDMMLGLVYTAIENEETWYYYETDENGNVKNGSDGKPKKIVKKYDLDRIRALQRKAYERHETPDPVCSRLTLKVLKNRFGAAECRANFIFDGKHSTFQLIEKESEADSGKKESGKWTQGSFPK